jgi:hypothetical protein
MSRARFFVRPGAARHSPGEELRLDLMARFQEMRDDDADFRGMGLARALLFEGL